MPSTAASRRGNDAEAAAARKYGLSGLDESTGFYDLYSTNGYRYQVKSCTHERANGNPGKFRFWKNHLTELHRQRGAVIVVLTTDSDTRPVLKVEKVPTSDVLEAIDGRWYPASHEDMDGEQYKLPWRDLVDF